MRRRKLPAPERIVQCVEAAVNLPFDAAMGKARELFEPCRTSAESRALRHLFFAERGAPVQGEIRPVASVGVIGSGTMGAGIAISLATGGYSVTLIDANATALEAGLQRVRATIDASAKKGRLSADAAAQAIARVSGSGDFAALATADLVIEAVFENMSVKQEVFARLGQICKPGAVLATNTSTLDVDAIAAASGTGRRTSSACTSSAPPTSCGSSRSCAAARPRDEALATAAAVTKRIGKIGMIVGNCFGFVGNRMLYAYGREKELMLLEGATPEQIDRAMQEFGMAMGPNAVGDLAGLDIGCQRAARMARQARRPALLPGFRPAGRARPLWPEDRAGFYRYEGADKKRTNDPGSRRADPAEAARLRSRSGIDGG